MDQIVSRGLNTVLMVGVNAEVFPQLLSPAQSLSGYDRTRSAGSYIATTFAMGVSGWMWCELHKM